jgi:uronate dehydrogenase
MTHEMPLRPAGLYGASKIWGEAIARHYADAHKLSAVCVRIGRVLAADRPTSAREFSVFCSQRDVVRMLELCIAAPPTLTFDIFYAVSDNRWGYRDLEHARRVLGFEPRDRAEDYRR